MLHEASSHISKTFSDILQYSTGITQITLKPHIIQVCHTKLLKKYSIKHATSEIDSRSVKKFLQFY
jgi:hypothetical protein